MGVPSLRPSGSISVLQITTQQAVQIITQKTVQITTQQTDQINTQQTVQITTLTANPQPLTNRLTLIDKSK